MDKNVHTAGCIKQNDQLQTLSNNDLVGSDCQKITHDIIIPPYLTNFFKPEKVNSNFGFFLPEKSGPTIVVLTIAGCPYETDLHKRPGQNTQDLELSMLTLDLLGYVPLGSSVWLDLKLKADTPKGATKYTCSYSINRNIIGIWLLETNQGNLTVT